MRHTGCSAWASQGPDVDMEARPRYVGQFGCNLIDEAAPTP